jgi:thiosulfate dehydrogenase [quinone] large subunit
MLSSSGYDYYLMNAIQATTSARLRMVWGISRILLGWLFFWSFFDKLFGLGFSTSSAQSWLNGGSPTAGYLKYATSGIFSGFYDSLAGNQIVDILFMFALLALGAALILGIGSRLATYGGTLLLLMLWSTNIPPVQNPLIDEHIIFIALLWGLWLVKAGRMYGMGEWWSKTALVKRLPFLE